MREFLWEMRYVLAVIVAFIIYCIFEWQSAKNNIIRLIFKAREAAKDGVLNSGKEQEDWVVKTLVLILPKQVMFFLNEDTLRKAVKFLYDQAKDYLDDGEFNKSYIDKIDE